MKQPLLHPPLSHTACGVQISAQGYCTPVEEGIQIITHFNQLLLQETLNCTPLVVWEPPARKDQRLLVRRIVTLNSSNHQHHSLHTLNHHVMHVHQLLNLNSHHLSLLPPTRTLQQIVNSRLHLALVTTTWTTTITPVLHLKQLLSRIETIHTNLQQRLTTSP